MAGRPIKTYTKEQEEQIDALALDGHKTNTIAVMLNLDVKTLDKHYSRRMAQKRVEGKVALKRAQMSKAINDKDSTMLVWLGKNELEQTDKHDLTTGGESFNTLMRALE
jgi:hypothetical protein